MTISITNLSISTKAAMGATVGTLNLIDETGTSRQANFILTEASAGFFTISGNKLVTGRNGIAPGNYSVKIKGNGQYVRLYDKAIFGIMVTAT
jgi:hypothetical protein